MLYQAFISYSHADTAWAKWLQRGLEAFKIDKDLVGHETVRGVVPEALRPIFRDREDFTAGETLPEQTLAALDASSALIVICSPDSARSNYVNEETRLFKARHPARPVIPLIVGGKPGDPERECFAVLLLNTRRKVKGHQLVTIGTLDTILMHPREVFRVAIIAAASAIVLMHNHPSGDPTPSEADIKVTRDLIRAGQLLKIEILDHVIVGNPARCSLRELGYFFSG